MKSTRLPRALMIAIFLTVSSVFMFVANLVVFEVVAKIFNIDTVPELLILGVLLFVLSGSFIFSTILGMRFYNTFTRLYYLLSSIWIGFFTYLFLVSSLYAVSLLIPGFPSEDLGVILVVLALLVSTYGIINARVLKIAKINIALQNLPDAWRGRRAIWISDVHLGQLYGSTFSQKIVDKVNALPHDIIFIGGDLYDGTGAADVTELIAPLGKFTGKLGTYFITGNHEEIGDERVFVSAVRSMGIRTLMDEMIEIDGLQLLGVDYHNNMNKEAFRATISGFALDPHKPSILLKHEPKDIDVARDAGISLQLSGHTHQAQMWPLGYLADFIYKGFAYGLKKSGNLQVYTSSGVGTWGPPMRVGTDCEIVHITFN